MSEAPSSKHPPAASTLSVLRRQVAAMRAVNETQNEPDRGRLLTRLAEIAGKATASNYVAIYLLDETRTVLRLAATFGYEGPLSNRYAEVPATGVMGEVIASRKPRALSIRDWPEATRADLVAAGFMENALVPLEAEGRVLGSLNFTRLTESPYGTDDLMLCEILGHEIATQLEAARLRAEAERRTADLMLIHELGQMIAGELDLQKVLDTGARHLARIADVPQAFLFLTDEETKGLRIVGSNVDVAGVLGLRIAPDDPSLPMSAMREQRPILIEDVEASNYAGFSKERVRRFGQTALMAIPLFARGVPVGAALLGETRPERRLTADVLERAVALSNQVATAMANARLVDDLRRSYRELADAQHRAIQRERLAALGELAASVAHEVRNPLAVIFNSLASLERLLPGSEDARTLHRIATEEAHRLNGIIGELLAFARPTEPQLQEQPLGPVLTGAVEAASNALSIDPSRIVVDVEEAGLDQVRLDAQLVRQAVINLVVNALQATGAEGRVEVRARSVDDGAARFAQIEVHNEGPCIPEDVAGQVFQPFFTTKATGAGLGLALVKRIAEAHRGEVTFFSPPHGGTTFRLRIAAET